MSEIGYTSVPDQELAKLRARITELEREKNALVLKWEEDAERLVQERDEWEQKCSDRDEVLDDFRAENRLLRQALEEVGIDKDVLELMARKTAAEVERVARLERIEKAAKEVPHSHVRAAVDEAGIRYVKQPCPLCAALAEGRER
jgi:DNA repair exonuclease SbcCD ATPase subunit